MTVQLPSIVGEHMSNNDFLPFHIKLNIPHKLKILLLQS